MANSIALITKYCADALGLNEVFKAASLTNDLETSNVHFIGTQTVKFPVIQWGSSSMDAYSRTDGYTVKDSTLIWQEYTLQQDLGNTLKLDQFDAEESGTPIIAYLNSYIRTIVVPTVDKYRLEKLVAGASEATTKCLGTLTKTNIIGALDNASVAFTNGEVPKTNNILYINSDNYKLVKLADEIKRCIIEGNFNGDLTRKVNIFDEAKIVEIPQGRWPALAHFIRVNPTSQMSVIKHNNAQFFPVVPGFRGAQIDYNLYHDSFVLENRNGGVYVGLSAPAAPTLNPGADTTFTTSQVVTMTCSTKGAKIYYTDDASVPTSSSTEYTTGITLSATKTIKAIAIKDDQSSVVTSVVFTKSV